MTRPEIEEESHEIPIVQIRPRFTIETDLGGQEIADKLNKALRQKNCPCVGEAHPRYASIKIPELEQHYWSPQLGITIEETDGRTIVRGLYGPRPSVWTMFVFFYAAIAFAVVVISALAMAMQMMGHSTMFAWAIPILIFLFFSLYHVAYIGKKKGHGESEILHRFFVNATGLKY